MGHCGEGENQGDQNWRKNEERKDNDERDKGQHPVPRSIEPRIRSRSCWTVRVCAKHSRATSTWRRPPRSAKSRSYGLAIAARLYLPLSLLSMCAWLLRVFFHGRFLIRLKSRLRQHAGYRNKQIVAFPIITSTTRPRRVTLSRFEIYSRIIATTGGELERDGSFINEICRAGRF